LVLEWGRLITFRQLATSLRGDDYLATATLELGVDGKTDGSVQVWAMAHRIPTAEFDTILDFGGQRLALCEVDSA
jgi:hypothetical protein